MNFLKLRTINYSHIEKDRYLCGLRLVGGENIFNNLKNEKDMSFDINYSLSYHYYYTENKVYGFNFYDFKEISYSDITTKILIETHGKINEYPLEKFQHIPEINNILRRKKLNRVLKKIKKDEKI